jgi:hypothetical protein
MEQESLKKKPGREPINLYDIRMTAYNHLFYGVGVKPFDSSQPDSRTREGPPREPIRRAIEIWHSSGNRLPIHGIDDLLGSWFYGRTDEP